MVWLVGGELQPGIDTARQDTAREGGRRGGRECWGCQEGREGGDRKSIRGGGSVLHEWEWGGGKEMLWCGGCGNLRSGEAKSGASED